MTQSSTQPDGGMEDVDRPPSPLFKVLFTAAMVLIAVGYTWVWQVKTDRVVAEPPPVLALAGATSYISADSASGERIMQLLAERLSSIPTLTVVEDAVADSADQLLFAELAAGRAGHTLKLRRFDAANDTLVQSYSVEGATLHDAVYRMAVQVSMSLGLPRPSRPPSDSGASSTR